MTRAAHRFVLFIVALALVTTSAGLPPATAAGHSALAEPAVHATAVTPMIAAGYAHTVGLRVDGTVEAVGRNEHGECDVAGWADIIAVAAGGDHTVGLKSDGTVVAVGGNGVGQLEVSQWTDITAIAANAGRTVGLKADGTVVAVGNNNFGQLDVSDWTDVVAVAAGFHHTVGLKSDGTVVAVGANGYDQLEVGTWTDIIALVAGSYHTVGLKSDGTVVAVGDDSLGQTGVSDWSDVFAVTAYRDHTVGLKSDGTVVAVGANFTGQLDVAEWTDIIAVSAGGRHTVGLKPDGTVVAAGSNDRGQLDVADWTDIVAVAAGGRHTAGLKSDDTVVATGDDYAGQLDVADWTDIIAVAAGGGHTVGLRSDGTVVAAGYLAFQGGLADWTDIVAIAAGDGHTVGLKSDGTVVAVGNYMSGQLQTSSWTGIVAIAAGGHHTLGLKSDGTVVAVGSSSSGQIATSGWTGIIAMAAGDHHTVGLRSDGTVLAVGSDFAGQLDVSEWTNISGIAAAGTYGSWSGLTVGLRSDGTVITVGRDVNGQTIDTSDWTEIEAIAAGTYHVVGLTSQGTVVASGRTAIGECDTSGWNLLVARPIDPVDPGDPTDPLDPGDSTDPDDPDPDPLTVVSIQGPSRYDTAVAASKAAFPSGLDPDGAGTVVLATGRNWPDALGGTALAGALDGPILLTDTNDVPDAVMAEIVRLKATKAVVLGGTDVVGPAAFSELASALGAANVERIAGTSRYETANEVAKRVIATLGDSYDGTAFVATGAKFPDALAAAPLAAAKGWPLFLAHPSSGLSDATKTEMAGTKTALVLGGTDVVSPATETYLKTTFGDAGVTRLAGTSRYDTAVKVAEHGVASAGLSWNRVGITTGQKFPDALAGGVVQAKASSVMLLTRTDSLEAATHTALSANKAAINEVTIYGSTGAVSKAVRTAVEQVLGGSPWPSLSEESRSIAENLGGQPQTGRELYFVVVATEDTEAAALVKRASAEAAYGEQMHFIVESSDHLKGFAPGSWLVVEAFAQEPSESELMWYSRVSGDVYVQQATVMCADPIPVVDELSGLAGSP